MPSDSEAPSSQGGASSGEEYEGASSEPSSSSSSSGEEYDGGEELQASRPRARGPMRGPGSAAAAAARRPAVAAPPAKRPRAGPQPKLTDLLKSASKEQLVSLVVHLNDDAGGELEGRVAALLPPPDLSGIKASITELERKMNKAFPHAKWGTNRDNYAYKRVGPPLRDLKAALLEHGRLLAECKRFGALLDYCLFALDVTDRMPRWDADAHNKPKQQAAKALEGLLVKALKGAAPTPNQRAEVLQQLEDLELPLQAARAALGAA